MQRAIERMRGRRGFDSSGPTRRVEGFTLVEMLVVIAIIMILLAIFGSLLMYVTDRARNTKTIGLIKTLHDGCMQYRSLEMNRKLPEYAAGNSNTLHYHLGAPLMVVKNWTSQGAMMEEKPAIVKFTPNWLQGNPSNTDPGASVATAKNVIDAWKNVIRYESYPGTKYCTAMGINMANPVNNGDNFVSIWSYGRNGIDDTSSTGQIDDITNWERVGRVQ